MQTSWRWGLAGELLRDALVGEVLALLPVLGGPLADVAALVPQRVVQQRKGGWLSLDEWRSPLGRGVVVEVVLEHLDALCVLLTGIVVPTCRESVLVQPTWKKHGEERSEDLQE